VTTPSFAESQMDPGHKDAAQAQENGAVEQGFG
jgi:hypothetical protein